MQISHDQHFLEDFKILNKIIETANIKNTETILEIGSGPGNLTRLLVKKAKKVIAVELDKLFESKLKELVKDNDNLEVYFSNALDMVNNFKFDKIVSNIPYSITEPLFKQLFKLNFKKGVMIIGKTFYDKTNDKENKWSIIINSFYKVKLIKAIPRSLFNPVPKTNSVLISFEPKKPDKFELITKLIVLQGDKKLKNAIIKIFRDKLKLTNNEAKNRLFDLFIPQNILERNIDYLSNKQFMYVVNKIKSSLS